MVKTASKFVWQPDKEILARANVVRLMRRHGIDDYWDLVRRSQDDPEWFWPAAPKVERSLSWPCGNSTYRAATINSPALPPPRAFCACTTWPIARAPAAMTTLPSMTTARLTRNAKRALQAAAAASHRSVSEFVLESALARADEALADRRDFRLNAAQWKAFVEALDAPPRPLPRLERLLKEPGVFFDAGPNR